jgi:hypothetical protein
MMQIQRPSSLATSRRGAARVSIVWMVVVVVLFLIALFFAYTAADQTATVEQDLASARADRDEAQSKLAAEQQYVRELSKVAGFFDEAGAPRTVPSAFQEGLNALKAEFPDAGPGDDSVQKVAERVVAAYKERKREIGELKTQIESLRNEVKAKDAELRNVAKEKDERITELESQLRDAEQTARDQKSALESTIASVRNDLKDLDTRLRESRTSAEENLRSANVREQTLQTRLQEQGRKLNPIVKEPESPDARVLEVSKELGLAWIDVGSEQRLARGTRFRIVSGKAGGNRVKAWAEVTDVRPNMAEVRITDQSDPFDPPVPGDVAYNPVYDPHGERNAVLIGRFSGSLNEKELRALLERLNITVQTQVDQTTDLLITGAEMHTDDNGEPLETPIQPSELPAYKNAVALGVQVIPLRDLREYFRY